MTVKKTKKSRYSDGFCTFQDGLKVTDKQVAKYVKDHTTFWQRLDYHLMCDYAALAFNILCKAVDPPKKKNWKFGKDF